MKLIGIVLVIAGIASLGSGNVGAALLLGGIGLALLLSGKGTASRTGAKPRSAGDHWSSITGKSYRTYGAMRHDEDVHLANIYSDPRFR